MKKNKKNLEKGITLIVLAITIVVLIIIASVGVNEGVKVFRGSKEKSRLSEVDMLQQVVAENYIKYVMTQQEIYIRGNAVEYNDVKQIINQMNNKRAATEESVSLKASTYTLTSKRLPEYYYELTEENLTDMGVSQVQSTYIVNYKTGEVIDKKDLVTYSGKPLYAYSVSDK